MSLRPEDLPQVLEERQREISEHSERNNDRVKELWKNKIKEISNLVEQGFTNTDEWYIKDSNWVVFKKGSFIKRTLAVSEIITEQRVGKYLSKHKVKITDNEMIELMQRLINLDAVQVKKELKKYILKVDDNGINTLKNTNKKHLIDYPHNIKINIPPNIKRTKNKKCNSGLFYKLFEYLFSK